MNFTTKGLVEQLRAARVELLQQRSEIDRNIGALDVLIGDGTAAPPAPPTFHVTKASSGNGDLSAKVLQILNAGPLAGSHVAQKAKADSSVVRACLKRLEGQRLVHSTGSGPATRWHLGAKTARTAPAAKEAVQGA